MSRPPKVPPGLEPLASLITGLSAHAKRPSESPPDDNSTAAPSMPSDATPASKQSPPNVDPISAAAKTLHNVAYPSALTAAAADGLGKAFEPAVYHASLAATVAACGNPKDPIEIMTIQQLWLAHFQIAHLTAKFPEAATVEAQQLYATTMLRLRAEYRQLILALRTYRTPVSQPVTIVKQQNVAAGDQQVAFVDQSAPETKTDMNPQPCGVTDARDFPGAQLGSKPQETIQYAPTEPLPQPAPCGGRQAERVEAKRPDTPRA